MMNTSRIVIIVICFAWLSGACNLPHIFQPTPTPPPGWRLPVADLLIDDAVLPESWQVDFPEDTSYDPTVNKISRIWGNPPNPGTLYQVIWRAYTIEDAEDKYNQLRQSQFHPTPPTLDTVIFISPEPPKVISYMTEDADEHYFACGWSTVSYCLAIARYRNYVVEMSFPLNTEHVERPGTYTNGLVYSEIELLLDEMDKRFIDFFEVLDVMQ